MQKQCVLITSWRWIPSKKRRLFQNDFNYFAICVAY